MSPGDTGQYLFYLLEGAVRMESFDAAGNSKIYWYVEPGCLFAEVPLFHQQTSRLRAVTTCSSKVCLFSRDVLFQTIFPQYPEAVEDMLRSLAWKIRVLTNQIATLSLDDLSVSICKFLLLHATRDVSGTLVADPGISQQALASLLGVHRVTCNRVLRDLEKRGIISEYRQKGVVILDEDLFADYLSGEVGGLR